ncbi:MAG: hypothetical protein R2697_18875 [Ilumatobacteraceae bacterium]
MLLDAESALVEQASRQVEESPRRGPLRPEQLLSVRQRHSRRLAGHQFRAVDSLVIAIATTAFAARGIDGALWSVPLADLLPVLAAAWVTWWLLRSMGLYRLGRSEAYLSHVGRVVAATTAGALAGACLHVVLPTDRLSIDDLAVAVASGGAGLIVLHTLWFGLVARWRRQGWLTPNLVVVGATAHAEDLIHAAIERRDVNILGIFDDRIERSPLAVLGVPVLGDAEAMLRHRIMPYVDLVVVTIDPAASARVREITSRLSVLPNKLTLVFDDPSAKRRAKAIDQLADAPLAPRGVQQRRPQGVLQAPPGRRDRHHRAARRGARAGADRARGPARQPRSRVLPAAPARVQQRGDRRVEVPHDAPRGRRCLRRAAGDRRRRPGDARRPDPALDEPSARCRSCST